MLFKPVYVLSLSLGEEGHRGSVPDAGLAKEDEVQNNVNWEQQLNSRKLFSPLHLKLGLKKQFITALYKESETYK